MTDYDLKDDAIVSILEYQARTKLKDLYSKSDLTYEELSDKSGLDIETLKGIENGNVSISPDILTKMLDAFRYFKESPKTPN